MRDQKDPEAVHLVKDIHRQREIDSPNISHPGVDPAIEVTHHQWRGEKGTGLLPRQDHPKETIHYLEKGIYHKARHLVSTEIIEKADHQRDIPVLQKEKVLLL